MTLLEKAGPSLPSLKPVAYGKRGGRVSFVPTKDGGVRAVYGAPEVPSQEDLRRRQEQEEKEEEDEKRRKGKDDVKKSLASYIPPTSVEKSMKSSDKYDDVSPLAPQDENDETASHYSFAHHGALLGHLASAHHRDAAKFHEELSKTAKSHMAPYHDVMKNQHEALAIENEHHANQLDGLKDYMRAKEKSGNEDVASDGDYHNIMHASHAHHALHGLAAEACHHCSRDTNILSKDLEKETDNKRANLLERAIQHAGEHHDDAHRGGMHAAAARYGDRIIGHHIGHHASDSEEEIADYNPESID